MDRILIFLAHWESPGIVYGSLLVPVGIEVANINIIIDIFN
jgi:hypothetical protein